jgi:hypothetical protein
MPRVCHSGEASNKLTKPFRRLCGFLIADRRLSVVAKSSVWKKPGGEDEKQLLSGRPEAHLAKPLLEGVSGNVLLAVGFEALYFALGGCLSESLSNIWFKPYGDSDASPFGHRGRYSLNFLYGASFLGAWLWVWIFAS